MKNSTLKKCLLAGMVLISMYGMGNAQNMVNVSHGPGYVNDVFYSLQNGVVKEVLRTSWDIAFTTSVFDSNIRTNGVSGVKLYTYPAKATVDSWMAMDTAGWAGNPDLFGKAMFDFDSLWEEGAFSANSAGHPDYGWGVYNPITHNVVGDSLYLLSWDDGTVKKFWMDTLLSLEVLFVFHFANLDGTDSVTVRLPAKDYNTKNFIYYSVRGDSIADIEPPKTDWDLVFTRWVNSTYWNDMDFFQPMTGVFPNYNISIGVKHLTNPPQDTCYLDVAFSDAHRLGIGADWKKFSTETFSYHIVDSLIHFVEKPDGELYMIDFESFDGMSTGNLSFYQDMVVRKDSVPAPTDPVVDDALNTFGWTWVPNYLDISYYEYSVDSGFTWQAVTANPQPIQGNRDEGYVQVRVKNDLATCTPGSVPLVANGAFTKVTPLGDRVRPFAIYPSPASQQITLSYSFEANTGTHIQIYNAVGKKMFEEVLNLNGYQEHQINVSELDNGIYILMIRNGTNRVSKKFIVNR